VGRPLVRPVRSQTSAGLTAFTTKVDDFAGESCGRFDFSGFKSVKSILSRKILPKPRFLAFLFV
jgi:hypothetical protein